MASAIAPAGAASSNVAAAQATDANPPAQEPKVKKSRTNTPWTPAEEQRLKTMRDAGNSWSEIAKVDKHKSKSKKESRNMTQNVPIKRNILIQSKRLGYT